MLEKLKEIQETGLAALADISDEETLNQWKTSYLGRNSAIMDIFKNMGSLPKEQRGAVGRAANQVKTALETAYDQKTQHLFSLYDQVRHIRDKKIGGSELAVIYDQVKEEYAEEWLLRLELLEQVQESNQYFELKSELQRELTNLQDNSAEQRQLIASGLELISNEKVNSA